MLCEIVTKCVTSLYLVVGKEKHTETIYVQLLERRSKAEVEVFF